jgi:hypothetical protein
VSLEKAGNARINVHRPSACRYQKESVKRGLNPSWIRLSRNAIISDYVKATRVIGPLWMSLQEQAGTSHYACPLSSANAVDGSTKARCVSEADLDEYDQILVAHDEIDLATLCQKVSSQ